MADYFLTNKAVSDLSDIWNYTFDNWSEKQADLYYHMLHNNFMTIAENPGLGKSYEGVLEQVYGYKVGRHIIFYRELDKNKIEITRILHERMDIKTRMQK